MKTWTNDYGDIPRWYWIPRNEIRRLNPYRRPRGVSALLALAAAVNVPLPRGF